MNYIFILQKHRLLANPQTSPSLILKFQMHEAYTGVDDDEGAVGVKEDAARTGELGRDEAIRPAVGGDGGRVRGLEAIDLALARRGLSRGEGGGEE